MTTTFIPTEIDVDRLRKGILPHVLVPGNRKDFYMCSDHSEDALTWSIFHILEHAAANPDRRITRQPGDDLFTARYGSA